MSHQTTLCLCIFAATLLCYALNRIPLWLSSLLSLCARSPLEFSACFL